MSDISQLVPANIRSLKPYQPGKPVEELERELGITGAIKIASNENPMGPSPKAVVAAAKAIESANYYPDGGAYRLRRALSAFHDISEDSFVFGAGCNEVVHMIIAAFCRPGKDAVLTHKYAFISYRLAALAHDVPFVETDVTDDLRCDIDALIAAMNADIRVVFLANPNNPTGAHLTRAELERVIEALPPSALLVMDEAYHEYAAFADSEYPASKSYRAANPRIITLRTFSKIYGLAGLRVGYGVGNPEVIDYVNRVRRPFNVTSIAQVAAEAALADTAHVQKSAAAAREGIAVLREAAQRIGLRAYPSLGNFVLVDVGREPEPVYEALLKKGVIVRPMKAWGLATHLRISVGTPEQTKRVTEALSAVLGG